MITIIRHKWVKKTFWAYLYSILLQLLYVKQFEIKPICHILILVDGRALLDFISEAETCLSMGTYQLSTFHVLSYALIKRASIHIEGLLSAATACGV